MNNTLRTQRLIDSNELAFKMKCLKAINAEAFAHMVETAPEIIPEIQKQNENKGAEYQAYDLFRTNVQNLTVSFFTYLSKITDEIDRDTYTDLMKIANEYQCAILNCVDALPEI